LLKDRVQITESGFKVFHENETRELFYGFFTLKDDPDEDAEMQPTSYWDPVNTFVIPIEKKQCFVEVAEKENGRIVERYRFYFSKNKSKYELSITTKANHKYGKGAHIITIEWVNTTGEQINGKRIYLTNEAKEKFYFLTDVIYPIKPEAKKQMDQYVYIVPEGEDASMYYVEADEFVKDRYAIIG